MDAKQATHRTRLRRGWSCAGADFSRHTDLATTTFARLNFATDDVVLGGELAGIDPAVAGGF